MASEFVGSTVLVTLKSPPDAQVRGVVADIQNQVLFLRDGKFVLELVWLKKKANSSKFFG
jgi:hypothetical protein